MKKLLIISLVSLVVFSCNNEEGLENAENYTPIFGVARMQEAQEILGDFAIYGTVPNGGTMITSTRFGNTGMDDQCSARGVFREDLSNMSNTTSCGDILINRYELRFEDGFYFLDNSEGCTGIKDFYGKEVNYSIVREGDEIVNITNYSPLKLDAFIPDSREPVEEGVSHYYLNKQVPFSFNYTGDSRNENGVLVVAEGKGDILRKSPSGEKEFKYNAIIINEDTGRATLPNDFFEMFELNELITLSLYRGTFSYISADDGLDYKFYILSQYRQEFVVTD